MELHSEWVQILISFRAISVTAHQQMLQQLHATRKLGSILLSNVIAVQVSFITNNLLVINYDSQFHNFSLDNLLLL